ncbi:hypothetical protein PIB30_040064 [Stylosanthes scabra]|uniref:Benzyl alcohol O-benzoyltransferase n=1 Tax=Stylosanthes scabra TaxID=79078 RepID=A0ABU6VCP8_9FABA|nr:hypothetical protein [Stylosanthes scabra]
MQNHLHSSSSSCTAFSAIHVRHSEPVLVVPAKPTPKETKHVSDIDDQEGLRMHNYDIMFYKSNPRMKGKDPAKVIVEAISMALVHYYPLAGRIREEGQNRKLVVDCNGEGVLFVEADAHVSLEDLGDSIMPPCLSIWKHVLIHVPRSHLILGCPLLFIQFLEMVATMARDPQAPVIQHLPVWQREIFTARDPPRVTCNHPTLDMNPNEVVSVSCFITAHGKIGIPKGYYGNAFSLPAAVSDAGTLCRKPLSYGIELIREGKAKMNEEYIRSMVDFLVIKGRPMHRTTGQFMVADMTRVGFDEVDFGWGKAIFGGSMGARPLVSFLSCFRNGKGEDGIVAPVLLPRLVMKRFLLELLKITGEYEEHKFHHHHLNDKMETAGVIRSML